MTVTQHEKRRNTPGVYGTRRLLYSWKLQWHSSVNRSAAWRWSWREGVGYKYSLIGQQRSRQSKEFLQQWGRMSGAVLFGLDPQWWDIIEEVEGQDEEREDNEAPPASPAPTEGAPVNMEAPIEGAPVNVEAPEEVPREVPSVAPAPVQVQKEAPLPPMEMEARPPEDMEDNEVFVLN